MTQWTARKPSTEAILDIIEMLEDMAAGVAFANEDTTDYNQALKHLYWIYRDLDSS